MIGARKICVDTICMHMMWCQKIEGFTHLLHADRLYYTDNRITIIRILKTLLYNYRFYNSTIVQMSGTESQVVTLWLTFAVFACSAIGEITSFCLIDKIGRRILILTSLLGSPKLFVNSSFINLQPVEFYESNFVYLFFLSRIASPNEKNKTKQTQNFWSCIKQFVCFVSFLFFFFFANANAIVVFEECFRQPLLLLSMPEGSEKYFVNYGIHKQKLCYSLRRIRTQPLFVLTVRILNHILSISISSKRGKICNILSNRRTSS